MCGAVTTGPPARTPHASGGAIWFPVAHRAFGQLGGGLVRATARKAPGPHGQLAGKWLPGTPATLVAGGSAGSRNPSNVGGKCCQRPHGIGGVTVWWRTVSVSSRLGGQRGRVLSSSENEPACAPDLRDTL